METPSFDKEDPQSQIFKKNSRFDLLDQKVDALSINLSPNFLVWDRNQAPLGLKSYVFYFFKGRNDTFF